MEIMEEKLEEASAPVRPYDEDPRVLNLLRKNREPLESLKIIENTFLKFGLSRNEIRVYIYLARSGMRKAREISDALSLHRTETYRILRDLGKRGLTSSVLEKPLKFIAAPLEEAIEILIKAQKLKIQLLEKKKQNLIDIWFSIPQQKIEPQNKEIFQILEGEEPIIIKANEILERTKEEIYVLAPDLDLLRFYHSGFTDNLEKISKKNVKVLLLTTDSPKSRFIVEKMKLTGIKHLFSNVDNLPAFIISDQEQLLFSIKNGNDTQDQRMRKKKERIFLWTNYDAFIKALKTLFLELWRSKTVPSEAGIFRETETVR